MSGVSLRSLHRANAAIYPSERQLRLLHGHSHEAGWTVAADSGTRPRRAVFYGTSRVGSCTQCPGDPGDSFGTLALFDLRAVDLICSPSVPYPVPSGFGLNRGECCVYTFEVYAQDRTITSGGSHHDTDIWPVKICNDLK